MPSEADFLKSYDPSNFERPSVSVDLILLSIVEGKLAALLMRRDAHPALDLWALPGGFVGIAESLDDAAARVLREKARLDSTFVEQLYTFGAPDRDPRTRVISVAYFALLPAARFDPALSPYRVLARLEVSQGTAAAHVHEGQLSIAFDHSAIIATAVARLRGKLDYVPLAAALLAPRFTLRQLQDVHEAILETRLNKPAFRRRMLDKGWLAPTGEREAGTSYRPAELYRFVSSTDASNI